MGTFQWFFKKKRRTRIVISYYPFFPEMCFSNAKNCNPVLICVFHWYDVGIFLHDKVGSYAVCIALNRTK